MNPFVNPHQRGIDLPPGCKDLIDVLKPKAPVTETENLKGTDAEFFQAPFRRFYELGEDHVMAILVHGSHCFLSLCRYPGPPTLSLGLHSQYIAFNDTVRNFFGAKGISAFSEIQAPSADMSVIRYVLPATALEAAELISQLLQQVYRETGPIKLTLMPAPKRSK